MTAPTARRMHVVRVATSFASVMKYSSQLGRWSSGSIAAPPLKPAAFLLLGAENPVAGVAEAGDYVGMFVQAFVDGAGVDH